VAPAEDQEAALLVQAAIARRLGRPLVLHGVRAWSRVLALLGPLAPFPAGLLLHSFSGPVDLVPPLAALGACFSFSGTITRHAATRSHEAARAVPADRLLVETDTPDILPILGDAALADPALPRDAAGRALNLPINLLPVLAALARLRGEPEDVLAATTRDNALRIFGPLIRARREPAP